MLNTQNKQINTKEILLDNILAVMETKTFGKTLSEQIVGGEKKLTKLIENGKIECIRTSESWNGKWYCKASDVLKHVKNMRPRKKSKSQKI